MSTEKGIKSDEGKLRFDLIPTSSIEGLAEVLTMGAEKYTPNGWKTVKNAVNRYYSALHRHLLAWRNGEMTDPESGLHHMKHVMVNAAFLLELDNENKSRKNKIPPCSAYDSDLLSSTTEFKLPKKFGARVCSGCNSSTEECSCHDRGIN
tara:strand:+ start:192 stop:641 length:450 start_codon:yes stop_codon:yes gene_type:complete